MFYIKSHFEPSPTLVIRATAISRSIDLSKSKKNDPPAITVILQRKHRPTRKKTYDNRALYVIFFVFSSLVAPFRKFVSDAILRVLIMFFFRLGTPYQTGKVGKKREPARRLDKNW